MNPSVAKYLYGVGIALLIIVHFFGMEKNGSQRWIHLGIFDLQPSEFIKIFLILQLAGMLSKLGEGRITLKKSIPITTKIALYAGIPFFLILIQPDLGSALMIGTITLTLLFISSISKKVIYFILASIAGGVCTLFYLFHYHFAAFTKIFKPHQMGRIYGWLKPDEYASDYAYQLKQAVLGIGSGQLTGSGFNRGVQVQNGSIPEAHTDFIFAVIGEDFGFIGASILITLYFIIIYRMIVTALRSNTLFGAYICVGIVAMFAFQVFQNIAMTVGLMPITGIPLPLISYGGSGVLTSMLAIGLVLSVQMRSKRYMFSD